MPKVGVIMGSSNDFTALENMIRLLHEFKIDVDVHVMSAHRTPARVQEYALSARTSGIEVIIAAAGKAAHLPGVIAAYTNLPVIGVPIKSSFMDGLDSLLSIVQMPNGIPVATVGVNGSENAAILAAQILSLRYDELVPMLRNYRAKMSKAVDQGEMTVQKEVELL
ncbi:5-(carboxyamino)imidazole ribonucleotide mutase [Christensenellaceae bacterium NSJ-44]|jgi:5-(carboxyamino)imidazole ribonucleotide mutase|uniref:N5-carboxyaminoimidazole ribonucleotide mutase n=1 Tax=Luoshenia tenuis TaxID=2763654 RepID=A0A926D0F2_9FIRM|nr:MULTISPECIES: 5-(carboxyamino)imidazole ribonucleotide mutase [Clostridia]MBC8528943.1 5-(carboxyamino)imidazole ribonucleotide mutase [Luoshenia tenuis]SCJ18103.1 N5-carboxyaminoimidazole ribonucleotide mutase [uncultured Clostridium sp.]